MKDYTTITIKKETRETLVNLHTRLIKADLATPNDSVNTVLDILLNIVKKNI